MAWVYDPATGEYYDDESEYTDFQYAGSQNPFMPSMDMGQPVLPGDWNKYGMEPYEQADVNQQMTFMNNYMKLLRDPTFALYTDAMMPGSNTFNWESAAGVPMYGEGGGGGYGGGGGGGYGAAQPLTPWSDSAEGGDPRLAGIREAIWGGNQNPSQVMLGLMSTDETDQEALDQLQYAANEMFKEKNAYLNAQQQGMMAQQPQTAMQKYLAQSGMADPRMPYDETNLPGEYEAALGQDTYGQSQLDMRQAALERANRELSRQAFIPDSTPPAVEPEGPIEANVFHYSAGNDPTPNTGRDVLARALDYAKKEQAVNRSSNPENMRKLLHHPSIESRQAGAKLLAGIRQAMPEVVEQDGKRYRTNQAGRTAYDKARGARNVAAKETNVQRELQASTRRAAAKLLARQGRSPARDQMLAKTAMMRQMGIGI